MVFIQKTSARLKISFPVKTVDGEATSCSVSEVPLSSSETNTRERPDIAVKNITTQNKPAVKFSFIRSLPIENSITLIATIMNIASEFTAYRVLSSERKSFRKSEYALLVNLPTCRYVLVILQNYLCAA